jgi:hypothetical protein
MLAQSTMPASRSTDEPSGSSQRVSKAALPGWLAPVAAVLGGCGLILLHASRFGFWIVDDAAITFAYTRNITDGNGSVLQPGATPTEGFSNPTWLALLAIGGCHGRNEDLIRRAAIYPAEHGIVRVLPHQFGDDTGIENDHSGNSTAHARSTRCGGSNDW